MVAYTLMARPMVKSQSQWRNSPTNPLAGLLAVCSASELRLDQEHCFRFIVREAGSTL